MKANDFRIGNLITINSEVQKIVELPLPENCTKENTKGIYLNWETEYILKNNFKESNQNGYYILTNELEINLDFCVYCGRTFLLELEYVHQLQNLFFTLTGKELEINL